MNDHKKAVDAAFNLLEHVFVTRKNQISEWRNARLTPEDRDKGSCDLSEIDKAHLDLLRAKLDKEMLEQLVTMLDRATKSSDRLGRKVFWLNVIVVALTVAIAVSAILELFQ